MKWTEIDLTERHRLLDWHAAIWEPLFDWGLTPLGDLAGKRVLEIGCGDGGLACLLALCGAQVYATDRAFWRLKRAVQTAQQLRFTTGSVQFICANAYDLPVPRAHFDLIVTRSVLILLERERFLPYAATLLKPDGGTALFVENMDRHPALLLWRRVTRRKWGGQPYLTLAEAATYDRYFDRVESQVRGLTLPLAGVLGRAGPLVTPALSRVDAVLFAGLPALAHLGWLMAVRCTLNR